MFKKQIFIAEVLQTKQVSQPITLTSLHLLVHEGLQKEMPFLKFFPLGILMSKHLQAFSLKLNKKVGGKNPNIFEIVSILQGSKLNIFSPKVSKKFPILILPFPGTNRINYVQGWIFHFFQFATVCDASSTLEKLKQQKEKWKEKKNPTKSPGHHSLYCIQWKKGKFFLSPPTLSLTLAQTLDRRTSEELRGDLCSSESSDSFLPQLISILPQTPCVLWGTELHTVQLLVCTP